MSNGQRFRQEISSDFSVEQFRQRLDEGWRPVSIEWERVHSQEQAAPAQPSPATEISPEPIPFGLKVAGDCTRLEDSPGEQDILLAMMELMIQDGPYSGIADELNRRGYRTREGERWTPISIFQMLPRLIEVGPRIFHSEEWRQRRERLRKVAP